MSDFRSYLETEHALVARGHGAECPCVRCVDDRDALLDLERAARALDDDDAAKCRMETT